MSCQWTGGGSGGLRSQEHIQKRLSEVVEWLLLGVEGNPSRTTPRFSMLLISLLFAHPLYTLTDAIMEAYPGPAGTRTQRWTRTRPGGGPRPSGGPGAGSGARPAGGPGPINICLAESAKICKQIKNKSKHACMQ